MSAVETRSEPSLNLIPADKIDSVLALVAPYLVTVVERSRGQLTAEEIVQAFRSGRYQLWMIWDGSLMAVGATEVVAVASGMRLCIIHFLSGENSLEWLHLLSDLEAWAKREGCHRIKGYMRKGWAKRMPDYHMTHVSLEKDLV